MKIEKEKEDLYHFIRRHTMDQFFTDLTLLSLKNLLKRIQFSNNKWTYVDFIDLSQPIYGFDYSEHIYLTNREIIEKVENYLRNSQL